MGHFTYALTLASAISAAWLCYEQEDRRASECIGGIYLLAKLSVRDLRPMDDVLH